MLGRTDSPGAGQGDELVISSGKTETDAARRSSVNMEDRLCTSTLAKSLFRTQQPTNHSCAVWLHVWRNRSFLFGSMNTTSSQVIHCQKASVKLYKRQRLS